MHRAFCAHELQCRRAAPPHLASLTTNCFPQGLQICPQLSSVGHWRLGIVAISYRLCHPTDQGKEANKMVSSHFLISRWKFINIQSSD